MRWKKVKRQLGMGAVFPLKYVLGLVVVATFPIWWPAWVGHYAHKRLRVSKADVLNPETWL